MRRRPHGHARGSGKPASAAFAAPRYSHTIGGPGHAGVYAWGAATAADGSILIGDYWNYSVRRFDTNGNLLQTFGSKGIGLGKNNGPHGLAVSPVDGTIYVSDLNNNEVDVFNADGTFRFSFADRENPDDRSYTARMAVNSEGLLYVADSHPSPSFVDHKVSVFDSTGAFQFKFGQAGTGPGQFSLIHGIDIGPNDDVYVADAERHKILVFSQTGTFLREFGAKGEGPGVFSGDMRGIRIDNANGWLYVVDANSSQIEKFNLTGTPLATWGAQGTGPGQFGDGGRELTLTSDGNVYAPDFSNTRVNVYSSGGAFQFDFPNPPIPVPDGGFNQAQDVAADPTADAVYVIDTFNHRAQKFKRDGTFVSKWGFRGSDDPYAMNYPWGIAVDPTTHDVWIANTPAKDTTSRTRPRVASSARSAGTAVPLSESSITNADYRSAKTGASTSPTRRTSVSKRSRRPARRYTPRPAARRVLSSRDAQVSRRTATATSTPPRCPRTRSTSSRRPAHPPPRGAQIGSTSPTTSPSTPDACT